jgi:hypothetical protein
MPRPFMVLMDVDDLEGTVREAARVLERSARLRAARLDP